MKSITEKVEEYAFIKQGIDPAGIQFREFNTNKQDGFEAGANYVLDAVEELISRQNWLAFPRQSREELMRLFQQLKSNKLLLQLWHRNVLQV